MPVRIPYEMDQANLVSPTGFELAYRLQNPVWVFDIEKSRIAFANQAACVLWSASDEYALCAREMAGDMSVAVAERLRQYQRDFETSDATFEEMWTLYPSGEPKSVMVSFSGFLLPDTRMAMLCEASGEVNDKPDNIRSAGALLHTDVMISLLNEDGKPLYMNPAARSALANVDTKLRDRFMNTDDHDCLQFELDRRGEHRMVAEVRTADGSRWHDISAKNCADAVTGNSACLLTSIDVSELKVARDKARYLADRDMLTGSFNRAYLHAYFSALKAKAPGRYLVIYLDVDRFKLINDRYGHSAGDAVLRAVASRMQDYVGPDSVVARLGGDEFSLLVDFDLAQDNPEIWVRNLIHSVERPVSENGARITFQLSAGVAVCDLSEVSLDRALRRADIALYASKQEGRHRTTLYSEALGSAADERTQIEMDLRSAIEKKEFELFYQPRVDVLTNRVVAAEALIRWNHPTRGLTFPDKFINICEETGMIEDLGRWVLRAGCRQAKEWSTAGLDLDVSINVSQRQFDDERLLPALEAIAREEGFEAGRIELEITESVLTGDPKALGEKLRAIKDYGYRIAVDDFGVGYSNLSQISNFPLDVLKIDRAFVSQLPNSGPIVNLIIVLSQQIGATVVAEGIETKAQLDWLKVGACDQVQGYYFARPVRAEAVPAIVRDIDNAGCSDPALP